MDASHGDQQREKSSVRVARGPPVILQDATLADPGLYVSCAEEAPSSTMISLESTVMGYAQSDQLVILKMILFFH